MSEKQKQNKPNKNKKPKRKRKKIIYICRVYLRVRMQT